MEVCTPRIILYSISHPRPSHASTGEEHCSISGICLQCPAEHTHTRCRLAAPCNKARLLDLLPVGVVGALLTHNGDVVVCLHSAQTAVRAGGLHPPVVVYSSPNLQPPTNCIALQLGFLKLWSVSRQRIVHVHKTIFMHARTHKINMHINYVRCFLLCSITSGAQT